MAERTESEFSSNVSNPHAVIMRQLAVIITGSFWGLLCLYFAVRDLRWRIKARRWPTTPGRIVDRESSFAFHQKGGPDTGVGQDVYSSTIKFTYIVEGATYVGDCLYPNMKRNLGDPTIVQRVLKRLPEEPPVHYDPSNPSRGFLLFPPLGPTAFALIGAMLCLGVAIWAGLGFPGGRFQ